MSYEKAIMHRSEDVAPAPRPATARNEEEARRGRNRLFFIENAGPALARLVEGESVAVASFEELDGRARLLVQMAERAGAVLSSPCPSSERYVDFARNALPLGLSVEVASHLAACPVCRGQGLTGKELDDIERREDRHWAPIEAALTHGVVLSQIERLQRVVRQKEGGQLLPAALRLRRTLYRDASCTEVPRFRGGADDGWGGRDACEWLRQVVEQSLKRGVSTGIVVREAELGGGVSTVLRETLLRLLETPRPNVAYLPIDVMDIDWCDERASSLRLVLAKKLEALAPGDWLGVDNDLTRAFDNLRATGAHIVIVASTMPTRVFPEHQEGVARFVKEMHDLLVEGAPVTILLGTVGRPELLNDRFRDFARDNRGKAHSFSLREPSPIDLVDLIERHRCAADNPEHPHWDELIHYVWELARADFFEHDDSVEGDVPEYSKAAPCPDALMERHACLESIAARYAELEQGLRSTGDALEATQPERRRAPRSPAAPTILQVRMAARMIASGRTAEQPFLRDRLGDRSLLETLLQCSRMESLSTRSYRNLLRIVGLNANPLERYAFARDFQRVVLGEERNLLRWIPLMWGIASAFREPQSLALAQPIEALLAVDDALDLDRRAMALHVVTMARWFSGAHGAVSSDVREKARGWFRSALADLRKGGTRAADARVALARECAVACNVGEDRDPALMHELIHKVEACPFLAERLAVVLRRYYHGEGTALRRLLDHLRHPPTASLQAALDIAQIWAITRTFAGAAALAHIALAPPYDIAGFFRGVIQTGALYIGKGSASTVDLGLVRGMAYDISVLLADDRLSDAT